MKPRSAPKNGALVPPSYKRMSGTEPAPTKTSRPVPMISATARWNEECSSIASTSLAWPRPRRGRSGRACLRARTARRTPTPIDIRHSRTSFGEAIAVVPPLSSEPRLVYEAGEPLAHALDLGAVHGELGRLGAAAL